LSQRKLISFDSPPGSLILLKNDPRAVNMRVDVKLVTSPTPASAPNQGAWPEKDAAPGGNAAARAVVAAAMARRRK
jgi:hypothetical protein